MAISSRALASQLPTATPPSHFLTLYERVAQHEKEEPGYTRPRAKGANETKSVSWLAGQWRCDVTVFATPTTPERKGGPPEEQDLVLDSTGDLFEMKHDAGIATRSPYLFYDPRAHRWVAPMGDATGWGVLTSQAWEGPRLVLAGRVSIMGEMTDLRQTITRTGDASYTILNQEATPDGKLISLDEYSCTRRSVSK